MSKLISCFQHLFPKKRICLRTCPCFPETDTRVCEFPCAILILQREDQYFRMVRASLPRSLKNSGHCRVQFYELTRCNCNAVPSLIVDGARLKQRKVLSLQLLRPSLRVSPCRLLGDSQRAFAPARALCSVVLLPLERVRILVFANDPDIVKDGAVP